MLTLEGEGWNYSEIWEMSPLLPKQGQDRVTSSSQLVTFTQNHWAHTMRKWTLLKNVIYKNQYKIKVRQKSSIPCQVRPKMQPLGGAPWASTLCWSPSLNKGRPVQCKNTCYSTHLSSPPVTLWGRNLEFSRNFNKWNVTFFGFAFEVVCIQNMLMLKLGPTWNNSLVETGAR